MAWFLPGSAMEEPFRALAEAGLALPSTALFPIPTSGSDPSFAGLLVLPERPVARLSIPRAIPCRCIADRLYLPVHARLDPPVSDAEVAESCAWPAAFFHPTLGLAGFDRESMLRPARLLRPPPASVADWHHARPGLAALPPLARVEVLYPLLSPNELFGDAPDDIASAPLPESEEGPEPSPTPPDPWFRRVVRAVSKALSFRDASSAGRASDENAARLARTSTSLEQTRERSLRKLLAMFDSDPDSALRHAVPLSSAAHRGFAPSRSADLPPHGIDFRLDAGSTTPADPWHVPSDIRESLGLRYRELADRELRLGRFRRAAYIYAHLLGDAVSAAHALKQGRHFREAAAVFEHVLRNPREAAACLVEGGFFEQALASLEALEEWLQVANLHERLGRPEEARVALRRHVDQCVRVGDLVGAADILVERFAAVDEALDLLFEAWRKHPSAVRCLSAGFRILAKQGLHDRALEHLRAVVRSTVPDSVVEPFAEALVPIATDYPDARVRRLAADGARVRIGGRLASSSLTIEEARRLASTLARLAPEDRLLARDTNRCLQRFNAAASPPASPPQPPRLGQPPQFVRRIKLGRSTRWHRLRSSGPFFYAIGARTGESTFVRGTWSGSQQFATWAQVLSPLSKPAHFLEISGHDQPGIVVLEPYARPYPLAHLPAAEPDFPRPAWVGTPGWLSDDTVAVAYAAETVWCARHTPAGAVLLSCHSHAGETLRTCDLTPHVSPGDEISPIAPLHLAPLGRSVAIAFSDRLIVLDDTNHAEPVELPATVVGLVPTLPFGRPGIVVLHEQGAFLRWADRGEPIPVTDDFRPRHGLFVPGGPLVLISLRGVRTFRTRRTEVDKIADATLDLVKAVGLCATDNAGEFAILENDGVLGVYRTSPEA